VKNQCILSLSLGHALSFRDERPEEGNISPLGGGRNNWVIIYEGPRWITSNEPKNIASGLEPAFLPPHTGPMKIREGKRTGNTLKQLCRTMLNSIEIDGSVLTALVTTLRRTVSPIEVGRYFAIDMRVRFPLPAHYHPFGFICVSDFLTIAEPRYIFAYYSASLH
jgi:hypothetical protein